MEYVLIKYVHFLGIFAVVGSLFAEAILVKPRMTRAELFFLSKIDGVYGIGALVAVGAGLLLWFGVGKPADFYTQNWIFLTKVGLFTTVGLLSIWPTVFFLKVRKGNPDEEVTIPGPIRLMVRVEVALLVVIPAMAVLMANGIGVY